MPGIKIFCEPKPDYYYFEQEIIRRVKNNKYDWLAVFPVNRAVRIFTRKLIPCTQNNIIESPAIFTFDNLLLHIYNQQAGCKTVISNELLIFLVEEILKKQTAQFSFLPKNQTPPPRMVQKITQMIAELRRFGYTASELSEKEAEELAIDTIKLDDFSLILKALEELLGERYIDLPAARYQAALNCTEQSFEKIFPGVKHIFISGYGLFTPAMYMLIEKVKAICDVAVKLEYSSENPELFENTRPAYEHFASMGAGKVLATQQDFLAQQLFNRDNSVQKLNLADKISFISCDNITDEILTIARRIHKIKNEQKISLDKIAVTFNPLENYVAGIQRIFTEYKIPFNLSTGLPLKQSPLIAVMINLLDLVQENFEYERVFHLYQSPFFESVDKYESIYLYKAIIKGRVKYLTRDWEIKLEKNLKAKGEWLRKESKVQVDALKTFLEPFYGFGTSKRSINKFREDYLALLQSTGLFEWYKLDSSQMDERHREREFRAFNKFIKILDEFSWSMQVVYGDIEIDLKTWLQHLKSAVARSNYNLTEWPVEAVQIMPRLEIQAVDYDILFLGGLIDGQFPRSSKADIFLNDENREKMGLLATEDLLYQDRFIFYSLLNSANKNVFMTAPRFSGDKALVSSSFIDDLKEVCIIDQADNDDDALLSLPQLWNDFGSALQFPANDQPGKIKTLLTRYVDSAYVSRLLDKIDAQHQRLSLIENAGIFEGNLKQTDSVTKFISNKYNNFNWSITQLEEYAFCPMQYFLKRILKLEEFQDFEEEVSPLERGNADHNILFKFYSQLRDKKSMNNPEAHLDLLNKIALDELNKLPFEGFFWELEKIRYFGKNGSEGLLRKILEVDTAEINATGFLPAHFEFCFGPTYNREVDPNSVAQLLTLQGKDGTKLQITGKIDRVDINPKTGQALVYDYKTGSVDGKTVHSVAKGISYQLPVYIMALEQLMDLDLEVIYGGYFQVKDEQNCKRIPAMVDGEKFPYLNKNASARLPNSRVKIKEQQVTFDELINFSRNEALARQKELLQGKFTHTNDPEDRKCSSFCDYKRVCQKYVSKLKYQNKELNGS